MKLRSSWYRKWNQFFPFRMCMLGKRFQLILWARCYGKTLNGYFAELNLSKKKIVLCCFCNLHISNRKNFKSIRKYILKNQKQIFLFKETVKTFSEDKFALNLFVWNWKNFLIAHLVISNLFWVKTLQ